MLVISDNTVHIPHIIWQPSFQCSSNCKGCYIYSNNQNRFSSKLNREILDLLSGKLSDKLITCDQLTISLDSFIMQTNVELVQILIDLWKQEHPYELWVSAQNLNTVTKWATSMKLNLEEFIAPLSGLSLSSMPVQGKTVLDLVERCQKSKTKLNYNKVVKESMQGSKQFEIGCRYADLVYLVLFKPALGNSFKEQALINFCEAHNLAKQFCGKSTEIIMDICLKESLQYLIDTTGCSAGISKITIWPNNQVTKCPYDTNNLNSNTEISIEKLWQDIYNLVTDKESPIKICDIKNKINLKPSLMLSCLNPTLQNEAF